MSLLTALLAFVPALAPRKVEEPFLDPQIELAQARDGRERAEDKLCDARHQINALSVEIAALRRENDVILAMVHERDRVIANLSARYYPAQQFIHAADGQRALKGQQYAQALQSQQYAQALQNQQAAHALLGQQSHQQSQVVWSPCTCVPGRYEALRHGIMREIPDGA